REDDPADAAEPLQHLQELLGLTGDAAWPESSGDCGSGQERQNQSPGDGSHRKAQALHQAGLSRETCSFVVVRSEKSGECASPSFWRRNLTDVFSTPKP